MKSLDIQPTVYIIMPYRGNIKLSPNSREVNNIIKEIEVVLYQE